MSITQQQAFEALDELEGSARGDEPFNHFAAPLLRQYIEQGAGAAPRYGTIAERAEQGLRNGLWATQQGVAPGADGWIAIPEGGMPPLGEQVLVWCKFGPHWGPMVDCWDEQHEAPLSFSSETIPIGPGWDSGSDFYDVTHWKPIGAPVVQHPQQEQPK